MATAIVPSVCTVFISTFRPQQRERDTHKVPPCSIWQQTHFFLMFADSGRKEGEEGRGGTKTLGYSYYYSLYQTFSFSIERPLKGEEGQKKRGETRERGTAVRSEAVTDCCSKKVLGVLLSLLLYTSWMVESERERALTRFRPHPARCSN